MLVTTMEERREILKGMGANFYQAASEYSGMACNKAWEIKGGGEYGSPQRA
jgi:hypothetical protein